MSDAQKHFMLQARKGLITEGLFSRTHNPNYLGKVPIYSAYAAMPLHWLPWLILAAWVGGLFIRNMMAKDRSLARYQEFVSYKQRTGLLFPKVLRLSVNSSALASRA